MLLYKTLNNNMQKYNWNYPTTMWVGENRINDITLACKSLNISKPLLVTDNGLAQSDIVKVFFTISVSAKPLSVTNSGFEIPKF